MTYVEGESMHDRITAIFLQQSVMITGKHRVFLEFPQLLTQPLSEPPSPRQRILQRIAHLHFGCELFRKQYPCM